MIYLFGDYELDTYCYELRLGGKPLRIEPKVFDLLAYLIQRHGHFVSKEDLYEHLWPDQFVSESALTYCVTTARKAVGDNGRMQWVIKTVYGRGYRFIAPVEERLQGSADGPAPTALDPSADAARQVPDDADVAQASLPDLTDLPWAPSHEAATADRRSSPRREILEAERRQLTVVSCRVVASPRFSEHLDPEELHEVMQDAHKACSRVIRRFEGHIAQHSGDGLMVYFGYPRAHEDDAYRAIRTGLEMVREMDQLKASFGRERNVEFAVRVGIHTGIVVMEEIESGDNRQRLALGDTPHVATQLASLAKPNTIVIGSATLRLVEGYFVYQTLGSHVIEDLAQPLTVYQVLQESEAQSRVVGIATIGLTPFVGRRQEIGLLRDRWRQVKEGMGQVVWLSGEAGIGKSRLVRVPQERMPEESHTRIECRCSPYYQNSAFFPVVDYMRRWLQWSREDTPQVKLSKLEDALRPYGFTLAEAVPLFASLLALPLPDRYAPLSLTPQRQKQKTLEILQASFLRQAEKQPVYFVMEDLHWTDPSTLELISLLIDQSPSVRILILLTFRPDFRPPWAIRSHVTHISLSRLTRRQVERMVMKVTRGKALPAEVLEQLVTKSDGVPLFVEEMTRMVLESGLVKEKEGTYELIESLPSLAIPSTLQDSLMARLDRLGTDKQVAQLGATLGREFSYELIQAVSPMDEPTLQQGLVRLVDAELLYQRDFPPQASYTFKHALLRDAAYQSLLRRTRRRYHREIAQVLQARFPETRETQPELLAHHYTEAGLSTQAISYWEQAGQSAMLHSAHVEAISHFRRGLALIPTLPDTPERLQCELSLQTALGVELMSTEGYAAPAVERAYVRARELCQQVGDMSQLFTVLRGLWYSYLVRGKLQTAHELGEQLLGLAQSKQEPILSLEAHRTLGTSLFFLGELAPALTHLQQGVALYDSQQHRSLTARYGQDLGVTALSYAAWTLELLGYQDQALHHFNQVRALAQQGSHPYSQGFALIFAAMFHQWRREVQAAQELVEASMALAHEHGFPLLLAMGMTFQGWTLVEQGQGEAGIGQIRRGVTAFRVTGSELTCTYMLALLAEAYLKEGKIDEGLSTLTEALDLVDKNGERWWQAELYRLRGELLLQVVPDVSQAETALQQALEVARQQQAKLLELRTTMSLARLWQVRDNRDEARHMLADIYDWFTEGLDTTDLKEAKALLDELR